MSEAASKLERRFTWSDYRTWTDKKRWEIIRGELFLMSSPTSRHQRMSREIQRQLSNHFRGKRCEVFTAPMDVVLSEEDVVQPDHLIVCDPNQIKRTHIEGAPTLVVEIMSGDSGLRDRMLKLNLYARSGVKEYWIVTPWPWTVEVLVLQGEKYTVQHVLSKSDTLISPTFPDLRVTLTDVSDFPLEPGEVPLKASEPPAPHYAAAS